jgi:hypothetical protein
MSMDSNPIGPFSFPSIPQGVDPELRSFLNSFKEWAEMREGISGRGSELDRFLTGYLLSDLTNVRLTGLYSGALSYDELYSNKVGCTTCGGERLNRPTNLSVSVNPYRIRLTWSDPGTTFDHIHIVYGTTNSLSASTFLANVPAGQQYYEFAPADLTVDYFFWIRAESGRTFSAWLGSADDDGTGLGIFGYETVDETIQAVMAALSGMDPPEYSGSAVYYAGMHVTYNSRVYRCYYDNGGGGITGIVPTNTTYWVRDGLLRQGTIDGVDVVGVDGEMVVDGTIYGRALVAGTVTAGKLVITDINALNLMNGPAEAGATCGADWYTNLTNIPEFGDLAWDDLVEYAKLGTTIIEGGYIKTDLLQVTYAMLIGPKPPTDATNGADWNSNLSNIPNFGDMAYEDLVQYAKLGSTIIEGGYIKTDLLQVSYGMIIGTKPPTNADNTATHTAYNTYRANNTNNEAGYFLDVYGDINIYDSGDVNFYDASSSYVGSIRSYNGNLSLVGFHDLSFVTQAGSYLFMGMKISSNIVCYKTLIAYSGQDLGYPEQRWGNLYLSGVINCNGSGLFGSLSTSGSGDIEAGGNVISNGTTFYIGGTTGRMMLENRSEMYHLASGEAKIFVSSTDYFRFISSSFMPNSGGSVSCGGASWYWSTVYANNFNTVADFYFMDHWKDPDTGEIRQLDDIEIIKGIKGSGEFDPATGFELIDDNSLHDAIVSRYDRDEYDLTGEIDGKGNPVKAKIGSAGEKIFTADGKPYLSLKTMVSLLMGAVRGQDERMATIENRLNQIIDQRERI